MTIMNMLIKQLNERTGTQVSVLRYEVSKRRYRYSLEAQRDGVSYVFWKSLPRALTYNQMVLMLATLLDMVDMGFLQPTGSSASSNMQWNTNVDEMPRNGIFLVWIVPARHGCHFWPLRRGIGVNDSQVDVLGDLFSFDVKNKIVAWCNPPRGPMLTQEASEQ